MKKIGLLAVILFLLIMVSCVEHKDRESGGVDSSDILSQNESSEAKTHTSDSSADTVESTSESDSASLVMSPPEGTRGAFFAYDFDSLRDILASEDFLSYSGRPVICIKEAFKFVEPLDINRDTDIIYIPHEVAGGFPLTVRCGDSVAELKIYSSTELIIEDGILCVDAPYTALTFIGDVVPDITDVELYCNVACYNGNDVSKKYGGDGAESLAEAKLLNSSSGLAYDGVELTVIGNMAMLRFPLIVSENDAKKASLRFVSQNGAETDPIAMDLTQENILTLTDREGRRRTYLVISERITYDLPVMEIHTDGGEAIVEKNTYIHGTLTIDGVSYQMNVRGRGNASWTYFPKKSYRIKLDEGASLFGLPKNRDWVLASSYADKSLIRNCVAHSMASSLSGLEYTPTHILVNLYLNGDYIGVYSFADKIEEGNGRLDLGGNAGFDSGAADIGFLIEIGWDFDKENVYNQDYFDTDIVLRLFIKEPEIPQANTPELLFIKKYILEMESAIVNNNGWENYIHVESWIDWFIINELTFNMESSFYRSCYMWRDVGGKLRMGPVWDFDMAFGNHQGDLYKYNGWCTTESTYTYISENWMDYLMTYDAFTDRLVERWNEVKHSLKDTALSAIDEYSRMLEGSSRQNFIVWDIMKSVVGAGSVSPYEYDTYDKQVQYLRNFINTRWSYIDTRLNSDEYAADRD